MLNICLASLDLQITIFMSPGHLTMGQTHGLKTDDHQLFFPQAYGKWNKVKSLSHVRLFATPWTVAYQALPSMGFPRQECWSGLPFPSPGDLPDPGLLHCRQTLHHLSHQGLQAYGTEVNYCPSLDLSADNLSDQGHISGTWDKGYSFRLMEHDIYWKQDQGLRVLHSLPSNFSLTFADKPITLWSISKCTLCHTKKFSMKKHGDTKQGYPK